MTAIQDIVSNVQILIYSSYFIISTVP